MSKNSQNLLILPKIQGFSWKLKPKNSISGIFKINGYPQSALKTSKTRFYKLPAARFSQKKSKKSQNFELCGNINWVSFKIGLSFTINSSVWVRMVENKQINPSNSAHLHIQLSPQSTNCFYLATFKELPTKSVDLCTLKQNTLKTRFCEYRFRGKALFSGRKC